MLAFYNINMKTNVHTDTTFAQLLRDAIKRSPYNNAQIAQLLGVAEGTVSNWVSGTRKPNYERARRLCILLDLDIDYTIGTYLPEYELRPKEQELLMLFRSIKNDDNQSMLIQLAQMLTNQ